MLAAVTLLDGISVLQACKKYCKETPKDCLALGACFEHAFKPSSSADKNSWALDGPKLRTTDKHRTDLLLKANTPQQLSSASSMGSVMPHSCDLRLLYAAVPQYVGWTWPTLCMLILPLSCRRPV